MTTIICFLFRSHPPQTANVCAMLFTIDVKPHGFSCDYKKEVLRVVQFEDFALYPNTYQFQMLLPGEEYVMVTTFEKRPLWEKVFRTEKVALSPGMRGSVE